MKTFGVLAFLAVAISAVISAPQIFPTKLEKVRNIQIRSSPALDPVLLDEAMLKAYNYLWTTGSDFMFTARNLAYESVIAQAYIDAHKVSFMYRTQSKYKEFRDTLATGDESLIRQYAKDAVSFGRSSAEGAAGETFFTVLEYLPHIADQVNKLAHEMLVNVVRGFGPVDDLLYP